MPNAEDTVIALHITFRSHWLIEHFQFDLSSVQYLSLLFLNFTPLQQDSNCQQHLNDTVSILFLITAEGFNKFSMMQLPDDPNIWPNNDIFHKCWVCSYQPALLCTSQGLCINYFKAIQYPLPKVRLAFYSVFWMPGWDHSHLTMTYQTMCAKGLRLCSLDGLF